MKLTAADADCKWCLDEIEAARDVQSSLVKKLPLASGGQRSATPGTKTRLAT